MSQASRRVDMSQLEAIGQLFHKNRQENRQTTKAIDRRIDERENVELIDLWRQAQTGNANGGRFEPSTLAGPVFETAVYRSATSACYYQWVL